MAHPLISTIEWFDPQEQMPDADVLVLVSDRFNNIVSAAWDDHARCWVQTMTVQHGEFIYPWPEQHCKLWAHIPDVPAKEVTP